MRYLLLLGAFFGIGWLLKVTEPTGTERAIARCALTIPGPDVSSYHHEAVRVLCEERFQ